MESNDQRHGTLKGLKVLDLADEKANYCSKLLADMGALVIKLDRPGKTTGPRNRLSLDNDAGLSRKLANYYHHTNKRSITLDIEHEEGRQLFIKLIEKHDVIVESFPVGYLKKLGLSHDTLRKENPGIIIVSVTGFGQSGPHKAYKSCDLVASAMGGQMVVSGSPSSHPLKHYGTQSYHAASLYAAIAVLLAVRRRRRSGKGDHIDISLQEVTASTLEHVILGYFFNGVIPGRSGAMHWNNLYYIFPCKDGYLRMTLFEQWETLTEWMDSEGMAADLTDNVYLDQAVRLERKTHIIEVMRQWTRTHTIQELFKLGQLMRFPWAPVQSPDQIVECPQLKERQFFVAVDHPRIKGPVFCPRMPFRLSAADPVEYKPNPLPGEANQQIYAEAPGMNRARLELLSKKGII